MLSLLVLVSKVFAQDWALSFSGDPLPTTTLTPDPTAFGNEAQFGWALALAPNLDPDAWPELLVSAPRADALESGERVGDVGVVYMISTQALVGETSVSVTGAKQLWGSGVNAELGHRLLTSDAPHLALFTEIGWSWSAGAVYAIEPNCDSLPDVVALDTLGWQLALRGFEDGDELGQSFAICELFGDLDPELLVSAPSSGGYTCSSDERPGRGAGSVYALEGLLALSAAQDSIGVCDVPPRLEWSGITAADHIGGALSCGDYDGDGRVDVLASTNYKCQGDCPGRRYVAAWAGAGLSNSGAAVETATVLFTDRGLNDSYSHMRVAGPLDLDGDGLLDLVMSVYDHELGCDKEEAGAVAIRFGHPGLLAAREEDVFDGADLVICGDTNNGWFGRELLAAGDLNGDGLDDLVVGSANREGARCDHVTILYGRSDRALRPDKVIHLANAVGEVCYDDNDALKASGLGRNLSAGDVDQDGVQDLLLGAPYLHAAGDSSSIDEGQAWVVYGRPDLDRDGFVSAAAGGLDCDDTDPAIQPGVSDAVGDGVDQDCDGLDGASCGEDPRDCDQDGALTPVDCDDANLRVLPGATERADGRDNDCDALTDEGTVGADSDGDGVSVLLGDCDDEDALRAPRAVELQDGVDNDCDDRVDEWTPAWDRDGDGSPAADDCEPCDPEVSPLAPELPYDSVDNDCDPSTPDDDLDGDGFLLADDCDDADPVVAPAADERCGGADEDCDGVVDEQGAVDAALCYEDLDGDGYGGASFSTCSCEAPNTTVDGDCDDGEAAVYPGSRIGGPGDIDCDELPDGLYRPRCGCVTQAPSAGVPLVLLALMGALLRSQGSTRKPSRSPTTEM